MARRKGPVATVAPIAPTPLPRTCESCQVTFTNVQMDAEKFLRHKMRCRLTNDPDPDVQLAASDNFLNSPSPKKTRALSPTWFVGPPRILIPELVASNVFKQLNPAVAEHANVADPGNSEIETPASTHTENASLKHSRLTASVDSRGESRIDTSFTTGGLSLDTTARSAALAAAKSKPSRKSRNANTTTGLLASIPAETGSSDSSLSPPPESLTSRTGEGGRGKTRPKHVLNTLAEALDEETIAAQTIRAYKDKDSAFDYYHLDGSKVTPTLASSGKGRQMVNTDNQEPENSDPSTTSSKKQSTDAYPYPSFTPLAFFEDYLADPSTMSYEKLYHRTAAVTRSLLDMQQEWDVVDKEIYEYEESQKEELRRAHEAAKALQDANQAEEDKALALLAKTYEFELLLTKRAFTSFEKHFAVTNPDKPEVVPLLAKLRDAAFFKAFKKRQDALTGEHEKDELIDKPVREFKPTKDEQELEKRKRSRLLDRITFNDANEADAYGWTYSALDLEDEWSDLPHLRHATNPHKAAERGRTRMQAAENEEASDQPDTAEDLGKRTRSAPKKLGENAELKTVPTVSRDPSVDIATAIAPGGGGTFTVANGTKVFAKSGKPVGRPPKKVIEEASTIVTKSKPKVVTKSKLDQMYTAHSDGEGAIEVNGATFNKPSAVPVINSEGDVNEHINGDTTSGTTAISAAVSGIPLKKKGGRPRKQPIPATIIEAEPAEKIVRTKQATKSKLSSRAVKRETEANDGLTSGGQVLQSTERDTTASTSRPTTSSSNNTTTTFDSLSRTRASTREKSKPPPGIILPSVAQNGQSSSMASKRKRTADANAETVIVDTQGAFMSAPPRKKRRLSPAQEGKESSSADPPVVTQPGNKIQSKVSSGIKRKRKGLLSDKPQALVAMNGSGDDGSAPPVPSKKRKTKVEAQESDFGNEEVIANTMAASVTGDFKRKRKDTSTEPTISVANPAEVEDGDLPAPAKKKRTAAQEEGHRKRVATNQRRKARKDREDARVKAGGVPNPNFVYKSEDEGFEPDEAEKKEKGNARAAELKVEAQPLARIDDPGFTSGSGTDGQPPKMRLKLTIKRRIAPKVDLSEDEEATVAVEPVVPLTKKSRSGREVKPNRRFMGGFDGADDDSEDEFEDTPIVGMPASFNRQPSEWELYQSITSPGHKLGKRVRKTVHKDLRTLMKSSSPDEEEL